MTINKIEASYFLGTQRKLAYTRLKVFAVNPGYFALFIGGSRGTGKTFALEHAFDQLQRENEKERKELSIVKLSIVTPNELGNTAQEIQTLLEKNENSVIAFKDITEFSEQQQDLLFKAMQTHDGKIGLDRKVNVRLVFISSYPMEDIRSGKTNLKPLLWDRISQLVVEFPSFSEEPERITTDFNNTWEKMRFSEIKKFKAYAGRPANQRWENFLTKHAPAFKGGFRDLDKLCVLYFNYRILSYGTSGKIEDTIEAEIIKNIQDDFFGKMQTKESSIDDLSDFRINENESMKVLEARFRFQVRKWAERMYGGIGRAETALGLGHGTMKNYTEQKIADARRQSEEKKSVGKR